MTCPFVMLQSLVLYGIYPYVVVSLQEVLSRCNCFGLRLYYNGSFWRVDLPIVDDLDVKSYVLGAVPVCETWNSLLLRVVASLSSCFDNMSGLSVVVVQDHLPVGRAMASLSPLREPVVMRSFDVEWVQRVIRHQFSLHFGDLDPRGILGFLELLVEEFPQIRADN